nr:immunoglobulin light chain junction region [Macaca mulatta]
DYFCQVYDSSAVLF